MYGRRTLQPVAVGLGLVVTLSLITAVHRVYAQDVPMGAIVQFGLHIRSPLHPITMFSTRPKSRFAREGL